MSKKICAAYCNSEIKDAEKVLTCSVPSCKRVYHERCTEIGKKHRNIAEKICPNLSFRCDKCIEVEDRIAKSMTDFMNEIRRRDEKIANYHKAMMLKFDGIEESINEVKATLDKMKESKDDTTSDTIAKEISQISSTMTQMSDKMAQMPLRDENDARWSTVVRKGKQKEQKEHIVVVKSTDNAKRRDDIRRMMRTSLDANAFKTNGIAYTANNGIAIRCADEVSQKTLLEKLADVDGIQAVKPKTIRPRIKILRMMEPEEDDNELIEQLKKQNPQLKLEECIILKREKLMRKGKVVEGRVNVIMEITASDYEETMKNRKIKHQWEFYDVVDSVLIRRCYNCNGFNHIAKECRNQKACPKCSLNHEKGECPTNEKKCINCLIKNRQLNLNLDVKHETWSKECEAFKMQLARSKRIFRRQI